VRQLLNRGAITDVEDNKGRTPLYVASSRGQIEFVRLLLDSGANADAKDKEGKHPVARHVILGETEVLRIQIPRTRREALR
jgi:ankyrin repeat protein